MIKTEQLRYLIELEKTKSFHKCAENLFLSQPAISLSVRNLEKELGISLFDRSSSGILPTDIGSEIIGKAKTILKEIDELYLLCDETQCKEKDLTLDYLHISSVDSFASLVLPKVISVLQKEFQQASFFFHDYTLDEMLSFVQKNPHNIGFDYLQNDDCASFLKLFPSVRAERLCDVTYHYLTREDAPFRPDASASGSSSKKKPIPIVSYAKGAVLSKVIVKQLSEKKLVKQLFEAPTPQLYNMYIKENMAAGIVPRLGASKYVSSMPKKGFTFTPIESENVNSLYLFYHQDVPSALHQLILHLLQNGLRP